MSKTPGEDYRVANDADDRTRYYTTGPVAYGIVVVVVEVLLYVRRNRRLVEPGTSTSTFTQLLSSELE